MATRVTLNTIDDELVVDKIALEGDRLDRKAEARWLANARSPHVVRLISFENDVIRTRHAGQTTLRTATASPQEVAALLLGLARTLAELHNRGLVHGKLTLDHVIVPNGNDRSHGIVLCSPSGSATEPTDDLKAMGEIVERLLERWDSASINVPHRREWDQLRSRLTHPGDQITAQRVARWMAPLVVSTPDSESADQDTGDNTRRPNTGRQNTGRPNKREARSPDATDADVLLGPDRWRGLAVVVAFVVAIVGVTVWNPLRSASDHPPTALEVRVGNEVFAVVGTSGAVAGAPDGCPPEAAVLDEAATVWRFEPGTELGDSPLGPAGLDGAVGLALATVPGATELAYEDCELWAIGPAGRTKLEEG